MIGKDSRRRGPARHDPIGCFARAMALAACLLSASCAGVGSIQFTAGEQAYDVGLYKIAWGLWQGAADLGDADAANGLGWLYDKGLGVDANPLRAAEWYRRAAQRDHAAAQLNLGNLYDDGRGVPKDYAIAAEWFRKAAEKGIPEAENNLGTMYRDGQGVAHDEARAAVLLTKAAEHGYPPAQNTIGVMYFRGRGVERNLEKALFWLELAAQKGQTGAEHNRDFVATFLKPEAVARIKARAAAWQPARP